MPNNNGSSKKAGAEILHEWDKISIWCMNHDIPLKMEITQNMQNFKTAFLPVKTEQGKIHRTKHVQTGSTWTTTKESF